MFSRAWAVVFLGLAACASASASALSYWSFNTKENVADFGTAQLHAYWFDVGPATLNYTAIGSDLNLQPGYEAGSALDFVTVDASLITRRVVLSTLNFSNKSAVKFTYAVATQEIFQAGEHARASYSLDGGSTWSMPISLALPGTGFAIQTIDFGDALDNKGNVMLRIDYHAAMALGATLRIDNMTVSAVPEPGATALVLTGMLVVVAFSRRRLAF